jgi:hypothetical protein
MLFQQLNGSPRRVERLDPRFARTPHPREVEMRVADKGRDV